eukprot:2870758-Amphidinium_carterae.2
MRLYVDDITCWLRGSGRTHADEFLEYFEAVRAWATDHGFILNHKLVVWSQQRQGRGRLRQAAPVHHLRYAEVVKDLGIDVHIMGARATATQQARVVLGIARAVKLHRCQMLRSEREYACRSHILSLSLHGTETCPLAPTILSELVDACARLVIGRPVGKNPFIVMGLTTQGLFVHPVMVQAYMSLCFWQAWICHEGVDQVTAAWTLGSLQLQKGDAVANGIGGLWKALHTLGWLSQGPLEWRDDSGQVHAIQLAEPHSFAHFVRASCRRFAARTASSARSDMFGLEAVDFDLARRALRSMPRETQSRARFWLEGGGQSWHQTSDRLHHPSECPLCHASPCDFEHMLWNCKPHTIAQAALRAQLRDMGDEP